MQDHVSYTTSFSGNSSLLRGTASHRRGTSYVKTAKLERKLNTIECAILLSQNAKPWNAQNGPRVMCIINFCRLCDTPTNNQIWCDDLCRKWNMVVTKEMNRTNEYPTQEAWDQFCVGFYAEKRPMFTR